MKKNKHKPNLRDSTCVLDDSQILNSNMQPFISAFSFCKVMIAHSVSSF